MSRHTRDNRRAAASWYRWGWTPSMSKGQTTKDSNTGWSKRDTRGDPSEYDERHDYWSDTTEHDAANDTEGEPRKEEEKTRK